MRDCLVQGMIEEKKLSSKLFMKFNLFKADSSCADRQRTPAASITL